MRINTLRFKLPVSLLTILFMGSLAYSQPNRRQQTKAPSGDQEIILASNTRSGRDQQDSEQAYQEELRRAQGLLQYQKYEKAIEAFKRANKLKKNSSIECYLGLAKAYLRKPGAHRKVIKSCDKALKFASEDAHRALAHFLKGLSFRGLGERKAKKLKDAAREFRAAIKLNASTPAFHYNLGETLIKHSRDQEGIKELKSYLQLDPDGSLAEKAQLYIEEPRRVREKFAPRFSLVTMESESLSLDDLAGKVVVLDFWATWCGPCIKALSSLKKICTKFSEEQFIMISISSDEDVDVLRRFIAKEEMQWPQSHDPNRKLNQLFEVGPVIPTYVVIDGEGIIQGQLVGWGGTQSRKLKELIKKTLKTLRAKNR